MKETCWLVCDKQVEILAIFPSILVERDVINAMGRNIVEIREKNEKTKYADAFQSKISVKW